MLSQRPALTLRSTRSVRLEGRKTVLQPFISVVARPERQLVLRIYGSWALCWIV
jgi:hypothetical protein